MAKCGENCTLDVNDIESLVEIQNLYPSWRECLVVYLSPCQSASARVESEVLPPPLNFGHCGRGYYFLYLQIGILTLLSTFFFISQQPLQNQPYCT